MNLSDFSNNQLKEELSRREQKNYLLWRENPDTICLCCKQQYLKCSCDYEDMYFSTPQPKIEAPCEGDHVLIEVRDSFSRNPYKCPIIQEQCRYCTFVARVWVLEKNPDKPHYYAGEIKGKRLK